MDQPQFVTPATPDLTLTLEIHSRNGRTHGEYITIHRKVGSRFEDLVAVKASELREYFPALIGLLDADAYFSINAFKFPKSRRNKSGEWHAARSKYSPDGLDLPYPSRKKKNLQWLTACFTDIDCHSLGVSTGQAIGAIIDAQDTGAIPPASMLCRSGRGVWAFWFLVGDADGQSLVPAFSEKIGAWYRIQHRLSELFATIGADAKARDPCRITRIGGTLNSKSGLRVGYWIQGDVANGKRYVYRLLELGGLLGIASPRHAEDLLGSVQKEKSPARQAAGRGGWRMKWRKYYADFIRLWSMRGHFKVGTRGRAVSVMVSIMRTMKAPEEDIEVEVLRLFDSLQQVAADQYTQAELRKDVGNAKPYRSDGSSTPGHKLIAEWLDITPDEAAEMESWKLPAARFRDLDAERQAQEVAAAAAAEKLGREEKAARRRAALLMEVKRLEETGWNLPTYNRLAEWLTDQGFDCCGRTVQDDLDALGIVNPRRHRRRRRRLADDPDGDRPLLPSSSPTP